MKKKMLFLLVLFVGFSFPVFAKAGCANDGLEFVLFLVGFLLVVAGFFAGTNHIINNRKILGQRVKAFIKKKIAIFRAHFSLTEMDVKYQPPF